MGENWTQTTLEKVVALRRGHDLSQARRVSGEVPVIGSGGIVGRHNVAIASGPGVVIGRATNLGRPVWIDEPYWPLNTSLYVTDFMGNDPRWVFHLFEVLDLSGYDSGSVQPMLNRNYIRSVPVSLPPLTVQRRIAAALGALDDLIETNERLTASLTTASRTLFQYLLTSGTPQEKRLTEVFELDFGAAFKGRYFSTRGVGTPLLRIRDLKTMSSDVWTTERLYGATLVEPGDVVVGMDAEFRPTIWLGQPSFLNQRVCRVRSKIGGLALAREALEDPLRLIEASKTGTTVIHLNKRDLDEALVTVPDAEAIRAYDDVAEPMREAVVALAEERRELQVVRHELLPLLMSGRVSPGEVDQGV